MALSVVPEVNTSATGSPPSGVSGPMWWVSECHGAWYSLAVMLPSPAFVGFLAWQARWSFRRLGYVRSHVVVIVYYALLLAVAILNLLWCSYRCGNVCLIRRSHGMCFRCLPNQGCYSWKLVS